MAEMAPRKKPSTSAYSGAVTGAQVGLNAVARPSTRPPIAPPHTYGPAPTAPSALNWIWLQAKVAVITHSNSSKPVLLTVPVRVMASPSRRTTVPLPRSRNVVSFNAGLPLRMTAPYRRGVGRWWWVLGTCRAYTAGRPKLVRRPPKTRGGGLRGRTDGSGSSRGQV